MIVLEPAAADTLIHIQKQYIRKQLTARRGLSLKSSWNKQNRYNGPDYWRYNSHEHVSFPAIAIVKQHERVIAKIWGPVNLSDNELVLLVKEQYKDSPDMVVERITGRKMLTQ